jgi:DNA-binding transcriptional MerR regulator
MWDGLVSSGHCYRSCDMVKLEYVPEKRVSYSSCPFPQDSIQRIVYELNEGGDIESDVLSLHSFFRAIGYATETIDKYLVTESFNWAQNEEEEDPRERWEAEMEEKEQQWEEERSEYEKDMASVIMLHKQLQEENLEKAKAYKALKKDYNKVVKELKAKGKKNQREK